MTQIEMRNLILLYFAVTILIVMATLKGNIKIGRR